jgi:thiol-disulfide isomerase/thioredoxin
MFGTLSLQMIQNQESVKQEALKDLYSESGLMVFYDENCQYCRQSIIVINYLSKKFPGLDIRVYARNTAKPDVVQGLLPNIKVYPDDLINVSEQLQITNWPSYVLVTSDNTFSLIAKGMVSVELLTDRSLIAGFEHGALGKDWFDRIHHTQMGLIASNEYGDLPQGMAEDPVLLINSVIDMINNSSGKTFYDDLYPAVQEENKQ